MRDVLIGAMPPAAITEIHYFVIAIGGGHLFCSIRHPLIITPIGVQRQALLTERLRINLSLTKIGHYGRYCLFQ
jgi:hypothetical protein